jgi:DNA-binding GntR family transcriptional regulator
VDPQIKDGSIPALKDVARRTAQEQTVEALRHAILGGLLKPGTPLVLADLAASLGVSPTPVREAIRDLAAEGIVDFDSYKSAVVHVPTASETREVYELMLILEEIAIRRSIENISDEELAGARALHELMLEAGDDIGSWVDINRKFHSALIDPADSPRLTRIIGGLRNVGALHVTIAIQHQRSELTKSNDDHAKIVEAFAARDAETAVRLSGDHLRATRAIIEEYQRSIDDREQAEAQT